MNRVRLRVFVHGGAEVLDSDGARHRIVSQGEAERFLSEDEFVAYDSLDEAYDGGVRRQTEPDHTARRIIRQRDHSEDVRAIKAKRSGIAVKRLPRREA